NYLENAASVFGGMGDDTLTNGFKRSSITFGGGVNVTLGGGEGNDSIVNISYGNYGKNVSMSGDAGNDTIENCGGANATISGGTGNDLIRLINYNSSTKPDDNVILYNPGDGNDSIIGFKENSTLQIGDGTGTYSIVESGNNIVVTVGEGSITLSDATTLSKLNIFGIKSGDTTSSDTEGKIITNKTTKTTITGTTYDDELINRASNVTIKGGDGGDYIATQRKTTSVKIYGEDGDDIIEANNATKALLSGGAGNDEIYSSGKQNTIIGGAGNDSIEIDSTNTVIQYAVGDGNDVIEGFNETSTLKIGDGSGTYSTLDGGDDVIIKIGDGQITLKGAASWLKFDDNESPANIAGELSSGVLIVDNNTKTPLTIAEDVEVVDATKRTKAIKITGNELENTILGGSGKNTIYGGDGYDSIVGGKLADKLFGEGDDDTLWGGAGNDTLEGGDGNDLFIYTAGKDVITDYTVDEDAIQIASKWTKSSVKGSDVVLTFGSSSKTLTIKDGKLKEILFVDADGNETTEIFGVKKINKSNFVAGEEDEYIDGSAWKKAATITGNDLDNTILGSSAYKNTIYGGEGDDYLV
ncbi:MAG: hypothetical protein IK120_02220, partial [Muribaculaceae bacterium]|nr:hypothetical protein [Muribaculaceae bacterium]